MREIRVVKAHEAIKGYDKVFATVETQMREVVTSVLRGVKTSLGGELHGLGLLVMNAIMELEITEVVGTRYAHREERRYTRWGKNPGYVVVNGQKEKTTVPRAMETRTGKTYALKTYAAFQQTGNVVRRAYQDLMRGISTRRYADGVQEFVTGYGASAAAVSRHMVVATAEKVKDLLERRLETVDIAVLMIDGVRIGSGTVVLALGIDTQGVKRVLGLWQGATENIRVVKSLLEDLVERGLNTTRPMLVVIDGSKALRRAVSDVLGSDTLVQRCTVHKKRNVLDELPKQHQREVSRRMTKAYNLNSVDDARRELVALVKDVEKISPSAARSLEEGMEETLTLHTLGIPDVLRRSLRSTNLIESVNAVVRTRLRNVKRWRDGDQTERWTAAALLEAEKTFRRVKGHAAISILVGALARQRYGQQQAA